jgi:hypothetical protein
MKLSIIVITANPTEKQYAWKEALASYSDLADEIIIVDGGKEKLEIPSNARLIHIPDPEVWNWAEHPKRLNVGLLEATGDWIIKVDIDWIFHENDMKRIKQKLAWLNTPIASFQKKTVYPFMKYLEKGTIPIAINKKDRDQIRFGKDLKEYSDLTYPIWWKGEMDSFGVPIGRLIKPMDWGKTGQTVWNFDYTFKTIDIAKKLFLRGSQSHKVYFGETSWGNNEEEAFNVFIKNMKGKIKRSFDIKDLQVLPKYIRNRIENIKPEEFGLNGWGLL